MANVKKSQWHPSQEGMLLGFLVELKKGIFTVPKARVDKVKDFLGWNYYFYGSEDWTSCMYVDKKVICKFKSSLGMRQALNTGPRCLERARILRKLF